MTSYLAKGDYGQFPEMLQCVSGLVSECCDLGLFHAPTER